MEFQKYTHISHLNDPDGFFVLLNVLGQQHFYNNSPVPVKGVIEDGGHDAYVFSVFCTRCDGPR